MSTRLAIIGAGPIGIEAALAALEEGFDISVFEKGEVGDAVRRWGHVRMFSPFGMNVSIRGAERLRKAGHALPDADAILSGREFVAAYLAPLGELLDEFIRTNVEIVSIGRPGALKTELIGDEARADLPLRLLCCKGEREWIEHFDVVLDCTGTFSNPNHIGDGGMLAPGERHCQELISYGVPDVAGRHRAMFQSRRVLVVGAGHSAATIVRDLAALPGCEIIWATRRRERPPCRDIPDDPLHERTALVRHVNNLVETDAIDFRHGLSVLSVEHIGDGVHVTLVDEFGDSERVRVDRVVAAVGYRPDLELARELQTQTCWATEGSYKLAAAMLGDDHAADCLAARSFGADALTHPEPGYFALGMKSYGRSPDFLIRIGREQVEATLASLVKRNA
jgi:thioredoxin reductase